MGLQYYHTGQVGKKPGPYSSADCRNWENYGPAKGAGFHCEGVLLGVPLPGGWYWKAEGGVMVWSGPWHLPTDEARCWTGAHSLLLPGENWEREEQLLTRQSSKGAKWICKDLRRKMEEIIDIQGSTGDERRWSGWALWGMKADSMVGWSKIWKCRAALCAWRWKDLEGKVTSSQGAHAGSSHFLCFALWEQQWHISTCICSCFPACQYPVGAEQLTCREKRLKYPLILGRGGIAVIQEGPRGKFLACEKCWKDRSAKLKPLFFILTHVWVRFAFRAWGTEKDASTRASTEWVNKPTHVMVAFHGMPGNHCWM